MCVYEHRKAVGINHGRKWVDKLDQIIRNSRKSSKLKPVSLLSGTHMLIHMYGIFKVPAVTRNYKLST